MSSSTPHPASFVPHVAEDVLPGHPDRIADAIAERIVDSAAARDDDALVGVEVAVFRGTVLVTGRIAAGEPWQEPFRFDEDLVNEAFFAAGYHGAWSLRESGFGSRGIFDPRLPNVIRDLEIGPLSVEERGIRRFSDDQNVVLGHASGSEGTGWLPPAAFVARRVRQALGRVREAEADALGPDGKVLVRIVEERGSYRWDFCNVAVQHAPGVGYDLLHRLLLPALEAEAKALDAVLPGLGGSWSAERVRLNGAGDFSCGGPHGDNGLSGKKLVVDHYGPGVAIGGGALCGKDPHKVDRAGALRARQLATRITRDAGARSATVRLGFLPGLSEPTWLDAQVDGTWWDADRIRAAIPVPNLSLAATCFELELDTVQWHRVARDGYFGNGNAWER